MLTIQGNISFDNFCHIIYVFHMHVRSCINKLVINLQLSVLLPLDYIF